MPEESSDDSNGIPEAFPLVKRRLIRAARELNEAGSLVSAASTYIDTAPVVDGTVRLDATGLSLLAQTVDAALDRIHKSLTLLQEAEQAYEDEARP